MPRFLDVTRKLSQEYNLPIRQDKRTLTDQPFVQCFTDFHASNANIETLKKIIAMPEENIEIMTHPAFVDEELSETKAFLNEHHIAITNYTKIAKH